MVTTVGYFLFGTAEGRADLGQALQSMKKNWYIARLVCVVLVVWGSSTASHAYFRSRVESVTMSEEGLGFEEWEHIESGAPFKDLHFIVHPVSAEGMTFYFAKGVGRKERVQEIVSTLNQKRQAIGP